MEFEHVTLASFPKTLSLFRRAPLWRGPVVGCIWSRDTCRPMVKMHPENRLAMRFPRLITLQVDAGERPAREHKGQ